MKILEEKDRDIATKAATKIVDLVFKSNLKNPFLKKDLQKYLEKIKKCLENIFKDPDIKEIIKQYSPSTRTTKHKDQLLREIEKALMSITIMRFVMTALSFKFANNKVYNMLGIMTAYSVGLFESFIRGMLSNPSLTLGMLIVMRNVIVSIRARFAKKLVIAYNTEWLFAEQEIIDKQIEEFERQGNLNEDDAWTLLMLQIMQALFLVMANISQLMYTLSITISMYKDEFKQFNNFFEILQNIVAKDNKLFENSDIETKILKIQILYNDYKYFLNDIPNQLNNYLEELFSYDVDYENQESSMDVAEIYKKEDMFKIRSQEIGQKINDMRNEMIDSYKDCLKDCLLLSMSKNTELNTVLNTELNTESKLEELQLRAKNIHLLYNANYINSNLPNNSNMHELLRPGFGENSNTVKKDLDKIQKDLELNLLLNKKQQEQQQRQQQRPKNYKFA